MIEPFLQSQLEPIAKRQRRLRMWRHLTLCWAGSALVTLALMLVHRFSDLNLSGLLSILVFVALIAGAWLIRRALDWQPDYWSIARRIEEKHPELHDLLMTAVEQKPNPQTGQFNFLQERVIRDAVIESQKHEWIKSEPLAKIWVWQTGQFVFLALFFLAVVGFHKPVKDKVFVAVEQEGVTVTPGDLELEKGNGLVVMARFQGVPPTEVFLQVDSLADGPRQIPLVQSLSDPVFGGSIPQVNDDLIYQVAYEDKKVGPYKVTVFEYPRLEQADAAVTFPDYTKLPPKEIKDTRRVSAVQGAKLTLDLQLNKPVDSARLIPRDRNRDPVDESEEEPAVLTLTVHTNQAAARLEPYEFVRRQAYDLELVDREGRTNKVPASFVFDALKNRRPELKITAPRGDQRVSALEEMTFGGEAWDDFGLGAYGLTFSIPDLVEQEIELGPGAEANKKQIFEHLLRLEALDAEVDQLVSWHVWADDIGPDGNVRRTYSDMFFAEVRPFEEIYRQGQAQDPQQQQQQQQQGQGQGDQATQLADLQKQIINATWNLMRQDIGEKPSSKYKEDVTVVKDSQAQAMSQAEELKQNLTDAKSLEFVEVVTESMQTALEHLTESVETPKPLSLALNSERAAYQALLKLASREYEVTRSSSSSSSSSSQSNQRNQQQLDELELTEEEDRYETESQATPEQTTEQQEQMQVMNRLKDLAKRQQDLNERLQELQNALQEAETEEEREEIRRRLKRLREQQQELLADVDELRERMERPENQSSMAESRDQLEQTREDVQRASEALEKEQVSQALASGTRAERNLEEMRDDFRKRNSSQFEEEMRRMRQQARDLARQQEDIKEQMDAETNNRRRRLTDDGENEALVQQLQDQRNTVTNLLENIRSVSEQSENVEPLLSKQLYDTYRKSSQANLDNDLNMTEELVKRRFMREAETFEENARREIQSLKEGVEKAAESVLGDDIESLRMARSELDDLARQVERERQAAAGTSGEEDPNQPGASRQAQGGNPQPDSLDSTNLLARAGSSQPGQQGQSQAGTPGEEGQQPGEGSQPGTQQPGQGENQGQQPGQGEGQAQAPGQGQGEGQQPGEGQGEGQQPGQGQGQGEGQQPGQGQGEGEGQQPGQGQGQGQQPGGQQANAQAQGGQPRQGGPNQGGGGPNGGGDPNQGGGNFFDQARFRDGGQTEGPLTGGNFNDWSDRMRNVEEVLEEPDLRTGVARIRDRARSMRAEFKRHGKEPEWDLVQTEIVEPLNEVRNRVIEELARKEASDPLVPIDRDPVPDRFSELVRKYYENLGSEK